MKVRGTTIFLLIASVFCGALLLTQKFAYFSPGIRSESLPPFSFSGAFAPTPAEGATTTLLTLPTVSEHDIAVDPSGVSTVADYVNYFSLNSQNIPFDGKSFGTVFKNQSGVALYPQDLVKKSLADNNFHEIHDSLLVFQIFFNAKISFEKKIKVTGAAIALSEQMIGFDELTLQFIQNALATEAGTMSPAALNDFYEQYLATASASHGIIAAQFGLEPQKNKVGLLMRIEDALGLRTVAFSAGDPPFGGQIQSIVVCDCNSGYQVIIGPPVGATLFVPFAFLGSPLFYAYQDLNVGVWWLGLYSPGYIPCLVSGSACNDVGGGNPIYMTGTSGGSGVSTGGGGGSGSGNGGSCTPSTSGPCSVNKLMTTSGTCFTGNLTAATKGSIICNAESGGNPRAMSGVDKTVDGQPVSMGLFQINKTVHKVPAGVNSAYPGGLDCPAAFSGPYNGPSSNVTVVNQNLYNQCQDANTSPYTNETEACNISQQGSNWNQWGTASQCGLRS